MNRFPCEIIFEGFGCGMNGIEQVKYVVRFTGWRSDGVTAKFEFLASGSQQAGGRAVGLLFLVARVDNAMIDLLPIRGIHVTQWIAVRDIMEDFLEWANHKC